MHYVGHVPSRTEIRQLYANTAAEKAAAGAVEKNAEARAVVDDVNIVFDSMRRLDETPIDASQEDKGNVSIEATPQKLSGFKKFMGWGETPVETIAMNASDKNDVANIEGTKSGEELDVVVSYEGEREPTVYNKTVSENGDVYFQRGNEVVGMTTDGLLSFTTL